MFNRSRNIILLAIFIALAVAVGQDPIPNVELVSATIFLSGMMLGAKSGVFVGAIATFLFSFFNAYGPAAPPLLAAQMLSMMLVGLAGGWVRQLWREQIPPAWFLGIAGWALTFVYDLLTTLSSTIILATGRAGFLTAVVTGFYFFLLHQISNLLIFALLLPYLLRHLRRLPIFRDALPAANKLQQRELQPSISLEAENQ